VDHHGVHPGRDKEGVGCREGTGQQEQGSRHSSTYVGTWFRTQGDTQSCKVQASRCCVMRAVQGMCQPCP
jgi:hypothetical protein